MSPHLRRLGIEMAIPVRSQSRISSGDDGASVGALCPASSGVKPSRPSSARTSRVGVVLSCVGVFAVSLLSCPDIGFSAPPLMTTSSEQIVEHQTGLKPRRFAIDTTAIGERTTAFLRKRYPSRTVDNVVADLEPWDVKHATVARMLERQTSPGTILWLALIWAYGPEFLSDVHPARLGWLSAAAREQRAQALDDRIAALQAERERL